VCFDFLDKFCLKHFSFLRRTERDMIKNLPTKYPFFSSDFNKIWILWTVFFYYWNGKFYENPSNGCRVVLCGRTDRKDDANSRFSQFKKALKNVSLSAVQGDYRFLVWRLHRIEILEYILWTRCGVS
jgi:hypothetical protein